MTGPRFLFCITGVGAGNATRNLAILEQLRSFGPCEIRIATQGRALEILREKYDTFPLETITYSNSGKFSFVDLVKANLNFPKKFVENVRRSRRAMEEFQPDVVLADSDFYCLRPARQLGIRLVTLNNSAIVIETVRRHGGLPPNCRFSYHAIERTDYFLQRRYAQHVLCPTLKELEGLENKFVQVPPMVRPDICPLTEPGDEIVVLTGGSGIDADSIDLRELEGERVRMIGTPLSKVPPGARSVGFTLDVMEHFPKARVLVVQGGFSSVSEAVALRVPTVMVPIANHAEQWVNGQIVESLGSGISVRNGREAGAAVRRILRDYDRYWAAAQAVTVRSDGHRVAAEKLWKWAGGTRG